MEEAQPKTDLLYSPRQIKIATLVAGPAPAIYVLVKNYNILKQNGMSRKIKYIGALLFVFYLFLIFYLPYKAPLASWLAHGSYLIIVWSFLEKYHKTKAEIIAESKFGFRSNWSVLLSILIGMIITIGSGTVLSTLLIIALGTGLMPKPPL